jgi:hypothetical protein
MNGGGDSAVSLEEDLIEMSTLQAHLDLFSSHSKMIDLVIEKIERSILTDLMHKQIRHSHRDRKECKIWIEALWLHYPVLFVKKRPSPNT